jgi:hypothetical protein
LTALTNPPPAPITIEKREIFFVDRIIRKERRRQLKNS